MPRDPSLAQAARLPWQQARQWPLPARHFMLRVALPRKRADATIRCMSAHTCTNHSLKTFIATNKFA